MARTTVDNRCIVMNNATTGLDTLSRSHYAQTNQHFTVGEIVRLITLASKGSDGVMMDTDLFTAYHTLYGNIQVISREDSTTMQNNKYKAMGLPLKHNIIS